jgi:site-specific DNA recombinase
LDEKGVGSSEARLPRLAGVYGIGYQKNCTLEKHLAMSKPLRVAIYTRVSTEDQAREGFSLQVQKEYLLHHAKVMNWEIYCSIKGDVIYEDDGYSAFSMDRPAFQALRRDALQKKFDLVLVYKQDRLSRNLRELLIFLEELNDMEIGFKSATEPFDTTNSAGKMAIQMLGSYAEFERNRLIERVFPGMVSGVKRGHWQGARFAPYGYIYNKEMKRLEINPEEAEIVKQIYKMYVAGVGTKLIARELLDRKVCSRQGHMFYPKLIRDILRSKVYLGTLVWNRKHYSKKIKTKTGKGYRYIANDPSEIIEVPNAHDAIIEKKDYELAQEKLALNRTTNVIRFKDNVYYLSGVVFCKECGLPFRGNMLSRNSTTGEKRAWYRCSSISQVARRCRNKGVTANALEVQAILEVLAQSLHVMKNLKDAMIVAAAEPEEHYLRLVSQLNQKMEKNLRSQKLLFKAHADDAISPGVFKEEAALYREEEKKLKRELQEAQVRLTNNEMGVDKKLRAQNFLLRIQSLTDAKEFTDHDIKEFVRVIFQKIEVENQQIVSFELNQPWKYCYEARIKECPNALEINPTGKSPSRRSYVVFCEHSAAK